MAWDFSTEPEFEQQLAWMRTFVREEILPLETLDLDGPALRAATAPMQEEVKARGLWAAHLPPELGGGGFGQVKLGLMHEILGQCVYAPSVFGNNAPDSGNAELLALGANEAQKKQWMEPLLDGRLRSAFSMTEPNAGADPTLLTTRAERVGDEYVINGHKWFTSNGSVADFLILMAVTDPDAAPRRRASMFVVPVTHPRGGRRARHPDHGAPRGGHGLRRRALRGALPRRPRAGGEPHRGRGRRLPARPEAAGPRAHPPLHALARAVAPRLRHALRARRSRGTPTGRCSRRSRWCRTGSRRRPRR